MEKDMSHLFVFTNEKAGMDKVDKDHVNKVVYEMSKNSAYFKQSMNQDAKTQEKVCRIKDQIANLTPHEFQSNVVKADSFLAELEATRDLQSVFVVVDMDMFYAQVEMRDNPTLRNVPLAVGNLSMISTTNYIARKFGVRAAMPGFIGKQLCPNLVFVNHHMEKYKTVAEEIRKIFATYDPNFVSMSLDEACLNITDYLEQHIDKYDDGENIREKAAAAITLELRLSILEKTKLTASAGIGCNKMIAKIASDINKPNGQCLINFSRSAILNFVSALPVRKFGGIGKVSEKMLESGLGIKTGADLYEKRGYLLSAFTPHMTRWFLRICRGIQATTSSSSESSQKSISKERTFDAGRVSTSSDILLICDKLSIELAKVLDKEQKYARNVTVKLKTVAFKVTSRSISVEKPFNSPERIYELASSIIVSQFPIKLRLLGIRLANFTSTSRPKVEEGQLTLSQCHSTVAEASRPLTADCPNCGKELVLSHNWSLNSHLDSCLEINTAKRQKTTNKSSILNYVVRKKD